MFYQTRNSFLNDSETASYRMECRYLHLSCIVPSAKIAIPAGVISICPDTPAAANIPNPPSVRWNPPYTLAKSPISRPISKARVLLDKSRMKSMKLIQMPATRYSLRPGMPSGGLLTIMRLDNSSHPALQIVALCDINVVLCIKMKL